MKLLYFTLQQEQQQATGCKRSDSYVFLSHISQTSSEWCVDDDDDDNDDLDYSIFVRKKEIAPPPPSNRTAKIMSDDARSATGSSGPDSSNASTTAPEDNHTTNNKGVDNAAFDNSEDAEKRKSLEKPPPHEAVNLELVDLTPPKIMAAPDAPDTGPKSSKLGKEKLGDYFVPVNEHKKGLMGCAKNEIGM